MRYSGQLSRKPSLRRISTVRGRKSGIWPWHPEPILDAIKPDNLDIDQNEPSTPPNPSTIEIPLDLRWREMRKAVDAADKQATYNLIEKLQAENQILKHQVAGYEEVLKYKERRKKKGGPLFELQEGETAGWYSPQKVKTAQERLKQLAEEESKKSFKSSRRKRKSATAGGEKAREGEGTSREGCAGGCREGSKGRVGYSNAGGQTAPR